MYAKLQSLIENDTWKYQEASSGQVVWTGH